MRHFWNCKSEGSAPSGGGSLSARKAGEQPRLTTRIIHLVILCWVIPYLAISLIMIGFFSRKNDIQACRRARLFQRHKI